MTINGVRRSLSVDPWVMLDLLREQVERIDVIFAEEQDEKVYPLGVKGLGEIGIVGTAAAVANAIFHATGTRVRDLPITLDKLLRTGEGR